MSIGTILLILAGLLILFGAGQRVLDRMRLTDREAILWIVVIIVGGFVPDIAIGDRFAFNIGGALVPLALCARLFVLADTFGEKVRAIVAPVFTAIAVFLLGRYLPSEPTRMLIDPNYAYGLAAGIIAYIFGRSRRCAFISGVVGVTVANVASWVYARSLGANQRLVLGGAGAYDVIVISGLIAVLLAELVGELFERIKRGKQAPAREYRNGVFVGKERS